MRNVFRGVAVLIAVLCSISLFAQVETPVKWKLSTVKVSDCECDLVFSATIDEHWHVYSLNQKGDDGPVPSSIKLDKSPDYEAVGKPTEGKPIKIFDKVFEMDVLYFEKSLTFKQRIRLKTDKEITVKGSYEYEACTDEKCTFPPATPFDFKLKGSAECLPAAGTGAKAEVNPCLIDSAAIAKEYALSHEQSAGTSDTAHAGATVTPQATNGTLPGNGNSTSDTDPWWLIFLIGFGWGFAALLTPCVFPLIPMNVSFFLKRSTSKAKGRFNALVYAISIIVIFVVLGLSISLIFGAGALNTLSTSAPFNLILFALLLIFAASFLGAFEIVLPSRFVNKIDAQGDRGGFAGIFFMALALVVVSFSCTGVMIGNALVSASSTGAISGPFWAMFGFSTGLAIPFGFFAFFPAMLNSMPKSGGWLNAVKVTLGFLELALALKFASNVDLVYQLGILTREVFLVLWIVIFGLLTMYLLGAFKTSHDSDVKHISVSRLFFIILSFSLTVYLIPGLWGAPLKLFSGILPPMEYSESPHGFGAGNGASALPQNIDKEFAPYIEVNKNGVVHFKNDYAHALAYAKKTGKPLMVDFTGHACANCRKTEDKIWPDPEVLKRLNNNVVLVSLYVDDKRELDPKDYQKVFWYGQEREITTIGDKFKYMEETLYKQSSQPLYVLLDHSEQLLNSPRGYKSETPGYLQWLDEGINEFKKRTGK
ncbi:MAG: Cytochrome c-type biosis protein DsbD, protein-disulfide reductase [Bacteroidetes bacterium]|nr:Cytochrome c-type biosis protein DsbD, protein-disulfide reductase [Bacteroidota bacterium]